MPDKRSVLKETLMLTAYTFFVLFLFQPFGTHEYGHPYKLLQLTGYGVLVLLCYPAIRFASLALPAKDHSVKREAALLLMSFVILVLLSFFYHAAVIIGQLQWSLLLPFFINGLVLLLLPFVAMLYRASVKAKQEAMPVLSQVTEPVHKLEIRGNNQYENFYFNAGDVLYLRSNGNYVMIYFQKEGDLKHEMVRNTLSQVSGQLSGADFIPIHRSFLVNAKKFDKLLREDGKHILLNRQFDIRLPVSRTYVPAIEKKLKDHS